MANIEELRQQRADIVAGQRAMLEACDTENRTFNSEETEKYERMESDFDQLSESIEKREVLNTREIEMAAATSKPVEVETRSEPASVIADSGRKERVIDTPEYRDAFSKYQRHGLKYMDHAEMRALEAGVDAQGGYAVSGPQALDIQNAADEISFVPALSRVLNVSTDVKIPYISAALAAAIVDEEATAGETDPTFGGRTLAAYKFMCKTLASVELVGDTSFDLGAWLQDAQARAFAAADDQYMLTGTGSSQPTGILNTGSAVGKTAVAADAVTANELIDLRYALTNGYDNGPNVGWCFNSSTVKAIRKLADSNGQYLWSAGMEGAGDTLLGFPVHQNSNIADMATGVKAGALVNFDFHWVARRGMSMVVANEKWIDTGQIGFVSWTRWDSAITNPNAVSVLTMA